MLAEKMFVYNLERSLLLWPSVKYSILTVKCNYKYTAFESEKEDVIVTSVAQPFENGMKI